MGDKARERGGLPVAAAFYGRALKLDGRNYQGWVNLAVCYNGMGILSRAEKAALRAVELEPSIPHAWQILAELRLSVGDAAGALKLVRKSAKLSPGSHIPDYVEAKILLSENNLCGAEKLLRSALGKEPGFAPAYLELLGLAVASGAFGRTLGIAKKAILNCADKECGEVVAVLGEALFSDPPSGPRLDAAAEFYNELGGAIRKRGISLPPNFSRDMALYQLRCGRLREAEIGLAGFLSTQRPDCGVSVESFRAKCCLGRYREAFEEAEELLQRGEIALVDLWNPWFSNRIVPRSFWRKHLSLLSRTTVPAGLLIWKDFYLSVLGSFESGRGANAAFRRISAGFSGRRAWMKFPQACETLSRCDFSGALAQFRSVAACLPQDPLACCKYGEALLCAGKRAAGFRRFDAAVSIEDWKNESAAWKGQMLLMVGDYVRAVEILSGARASFSDGWLGAAYYKTGRLAEAESLLEAAVKKNDPLDYEVKVWLAELYRVTGRLPASRKLLDELLIKEPDYVFARVNRALLFMAMGKYRLMRRDFARTDKILVQAAAAGIGIKTARGFSQEEEVRILDWILEQAGGNRRIEKYFLNMRFPGWVPAPARPGGPRGAARHLWL